MVHVLILPRTFCVMMTMELLFTVQVVKKNVFFLHIMQEWNANKIYHT